MLSNNFDIGFVLHKKVVNCQQVKLGRIGGLFFRHRFTQIDTDF